MSKSVLVIDTPENCIRCPLLNDADECTVQDDNANFNAGYSWDELMKGCPLKPLPEKMIIPRGARNTDSLEYAFGYNTCINEITGGEVDGEIDT
jgi:hypothetical protein